MFKNAHPYQIERVPPFARRRVVALAGRVLGGGHASCRSHDDVMSLAVAESALGTRHHPKHPETFHFGCGENHRFEPESTAHTPLLLSHLSDVPKDAWFQRLFVITRRDTLGDHLTPPNVVWALANYADPGNPGTKVVRAFDDLQMRIQEDASSPQNIVVEFSVEPSSPSEPPTTSVHTFALMDTYIFDAWTLRYMRRPKDTSPAP